MKGGRAVTHLTSTCRTRGRADTARARSHFLRSGSRRNWEGPHQPPGLPLGGYRAGADAHARPRWGRPRTAAVRAAGPPRSKGPPAPRHHPSPRTRGRAPMLPRRSREATPRLRPAAKGAGRTYRRRRQQPFSAGAPACGAEKPAALRQVQPAAAEARPAGDRGGSAAPQAERPRLRGQGGAGRRTLGARGGTQGGALVRGVAESGSSGGGAGLGGGPSAPGAGPRESPLYVGRGRMRALGARGRGQGRVLGARGWGKLGPRHVRRCRGLDLWGQGGKAGPGRVRAGARIEVVRGPGEAGSEPSARGAGPRENPRYVRRGRGRVLRGRGGAGLGGGPQREGRGQGEPSYVGRV